MIGNQPGSPKESLISWLNSRVQSLSDKLAYGSDLTSQDIEAFEEARERYIHYLAQAVLMKNTLKQIAEHPCSGLQGQCSACAAKAVIKEIGQ